MSHSNISRPVHAATTPSAPSARRPPRPPAYRSRRVHAACVLFKPPPHARRPLCTPIWLYHPHALARSIERALAGFRRPRAVVAFHRPAHMRVRRLFRDTPCRRRPVHAVVRRAGSFSMLCAAAAPHHHVHTPMTVRRHPRAAAAAFHRPAPLVLLYPHEFIRYIATLNGSNRDNVVHLHLL